MEAQRFAVRAMPAQGHDRRWCAQRPFTRDLVEVVVTDHPKPHKREGQKIVEYSYELTPVELEELRRDPHISVSVVGSGDADPLELNAAKARVHDLEIEVAQVRREHQAEIEDMKAFRAGAMKQAEELGAKVAALESELASARAQLSERGKKR